MKPVFTWQILDDIPNPTGALGADVTNFGAVGDCVTDDTAAINAAIAALDDGDTLYFPAGCYIVKAPAPGTYAILPLDNKHIKICGDGVGVSTIKVADACPTHAFVLGPSHYSNDLTGLEICDLTFDHNIANNPITNLAEVQTYPEYTCGTMHGNDVYLHDFEVINASSYVNIHHGDWGNDATNIRVENITCSGIGDDPNHIVHDASFINIKGTGLIVRDCVLSCDSQQLPGGVTAMEMDGSDSLVQNNTMTNFQAGILPRGMSRWPVTNFLVDSNTISGCNAGINIWSRAYETHVAGYGIDGMTISNNDIDLVQADVASAARLGIFCDAQNDLEINDLTIEYNNITMPLETVGSGHSYVEFWGGIGFIQDVHLSGLCNSSINNNTINNMPMAGMHFRVKLDTVSITDNTLTDCGSTTESPLPNAIYHSPMLFEHINTNALDVSDNIMTDDNAVTRIVHFVSCANDTACTGMTLNGNTYSATGDGVTLGAQIFLNDDDVVPLITETIADFTPPAHEVDPASTVIDGIYTWTVDGTGLIWSKCITGDTLYVVSPNAHPESTSVDGCVGAWLGGGETWANAIAEAGNAADDSTGATFAAWAQATADSGKFAVLYRSILVFDTSPLPPGAVIDEACLKVCIAYKENNLGWTNTHAGLTLVSSAPASNTALANGDFDSLGGTRFATDLPYNTLTPGTYATFQLNAAGIAAIDLAGVTKFGMKFTCDYTATAPAWADSAQTMVQIVYADDVTNIPRLEIQYH